MYTISGTISGWFLTKHQINKNTISLKPEINALICGCLLYFTSTWSKGCVCQLWLVDFDPFCLHQLLECFFFAFLLEGLLAVAIIVINKRKKKRHYFFLVGFWTIEVACYWKLHEVNFIWLVDIKEKKR